MASRGRTAGFKMTDEHRAKIANSQILKRLIEFAEGKEGVEMSSAQVAAATTLLRKVMPDMQQSESSMSIEGSLELVKRIAR